MGAAASITCTAASGVTYPALVERPTLPMKRLERRSFYRPSACIVNTISGVGFANHDDLNSVPGYPADPSCCWHRVGSPFSDASLGHMQTDLKDELSINPQAGEYSVVLFQQLVVSHEVDEVRCTFTNIQ